MTFIVVLPGLRARCVTLASRNPAESGLEGDDLLGLAGVGEGQLALGEDHADVRPLVRVGVARAGREHDFADAHLVVLEQHLDRRLRHRVLRRGRDRRGFGGSRSPAVAVRGAAVARSPTIPSTPVTATPVTSPAR